ncbi:siphovirus Gp157 family protein [Streptococcus gordonii]|uniref:siphovirus Gp157 family protein n=2 Tax=Streptococcus TaxID=1301 RepID=UPI001D06A170|nr:siphovirus Gp157 family protein [Streptococcus gordonii]MCB6407394.1 siphovirus Gp157 family protein [Streptococcus gordonii]
MATLYELTGQFLDIYNMDLDDETKLDTLESIDWNEDYENKVENYIKVMKNLEADIEARKTELDRLKKLNDADKKKIERMKDDLTASMELTGHDKIDTTLFKVSFRRSKSVEVDMVLLPEQYKKIEYKADKAGLKQLLANGEEIAGAKLVENKNLNIR